LIDPRFRARTGASIVLRSPTTTTANRSGTMYFFDTRSTSALVTAWIF
jgi:hypothetical protein